MRSSHKIICVEATSRSTRTASHKYTVATRSLNTGCVRSSSEAAAREHIIDRAESSNGHVEICSALQVLRNASYKLSKFILVLVRWLSSSSTGYVHCEESRSRSGRETLCKYTMYASTSHSSEMRVSCHSFASCGLECTVLHFTAGQTPRKPLMACRGSTFPR